MTRAEIFSARCSVVGLKGRIRTRAGSGRSMILVRWIFSVFMVGRLLHGADERQPRRFVRDTYPTCGKVLLVLCIRNQALSQSLCAHRRIKSWRRHAIEPHSLTESGVFKRQNGMYSKVAQEGFRQHPAHKGNAPGVEPAPAPWKPVWMQNGSDIKSQVEILHQCDPGAKRRHKSGYQFDVDPQQREERHQEMAKNQH